MEFASSNISPSLVSPIAFVIEFNSPKDSLFNKRLIITGITIKAMETMVITPQVFLIMLKLLLTVLNASFIEAQTIGTKLLMANLAVLIDRVSVPWDIMFFKEKINIKIDIVKIITEVNVVFMVFDTPWKFAPPSGLIQEKDKQIFTSGKSDTTKKLSIIAMNKDIEVAVTAALAIFPFIMLNMLIRGRKAFTTLHIAFK